LIRLRRQSVVAAALALLACGVAIAQGETLYVIEQLVVSVTSTADGSGERVGQIHSGDRVESLEKQDDQTRVRLPSGEEGWVKSSYLSSSPPMREQLKARTEELEKLRQEKTKLEADLASARKAASTAIAATASPPATAPAAVASAPIAAEPAPAQPSAAEPAPSNPPLFSAEGFMPSRPSWIVALICSVAALGIGFALGWRMLDRRIRAKYGGLRIY
jgi:hypothetical protein